MTPIKLGDYAGGFFKFFPNGKTIFFTYVDKHIRHVHWVEVKGGEAKIFVHPQDEEDLYAQHPELKISPISLKEMGVTSSIEEIIQDREQAKNFWV
jgi:hypothetical protein